MLIPLSHYDVVFANKSAVLLATALTTALAPTLATALATALTNALANTLAIAIAGLYPPPPPLPLPTACLCLLLVGCCIVFCRPLLSLHAIMRPLILLLPATFAAYYCPLPPLPPLPLPLGCHRCHRHCHHRHCHHRG
jgi:hypothetical protein